MKRKIFLALFLVFLVVIYLSCTREKPCDLENIEKVEINGYSFFVEIADTPEERTHGLMYRENMNDTEGMLFVFDSEGVYSFWMKNTLIDLDIAFLDKRGVIVDIKQMKKYVERTTVSDEPAMYAVEMNTGWFLRNNVVKGDKLEFVRLDR